MIFENLNNKADYLLDFAIAQLSNSTPMGLEIVSEGLH